MTRDHAAYLEAVRQPGQTVNPLFRSMGLEVAAFSPGHAELQLTVAQEHIQGAGVAAGGILATLLDEVMAHAVICGLDNGNSTATVEMSVRFLKAVRQGDRLRATADVVRRGRTLVTVNGTCVNGGDALVATAAATFMVI